MPNLSVLSARAAVLALAAAVALVPTGCNSDPGVNSYTVPKDATPPEGGYRLLGLMVPADNPQWFFKYTCTTEVLTKYEADFDKLAASVALVNGEPQFAPPEGWERGPGRESQFVKVFATVNTKDKSQEVSITQSGGGVPTNLKRWVGQIGLQPGPDMLVKYTKLIDTKGGKALRVALQGPKNPVTDRGMGGPGGPGMMPKDEFHGGGGPSGPSDVTKGEYRILGAMFPAEEPQWFVKLPGSAAGLEPHVAGFDKLLASFTFPPGAPPAFEAPPGWTVGPGRMGIVTATLRTPDGKHEVTITSSIGGVFPNLRRWAVEQLGNGTFTQDDVPKITKPIDAKGGKGLRVDVRGPNNPAGKAGPFMGGGK
jgi:hypothetical protein